LSAVFNVKYIFFIVETSSEDTEIERNVSFLVLYTSQALETLKNRYSLLQQSEMSV